MKRGRIYVNRHAASLWLLALLAGTGCSPTQPQSQGTISLKLLLDEPAQAGFSLAPSQVLPDSVVVRVFRGGSGVVLETSRGSAVGGAGDVDITISCIAEVDKKVSVELFNGPHMAYFGVNERVDVLEDENTNVMINAGVMYVTSVDVNPSMVVEGTSYTVSWSRPAEAESFVLLESSDPGFPPQESQTHLTPDTALTLPPRPAGAHYYAVVPVNAYAWGTPSGLAYAYVQTIGEQPPSFSNIVPTSAAPGERVTLQGSNMAVPGTRVFVGEAECLVVSQSETELDFLVALGASTGKITLETLMGIVDPAVPVTLTVNRIAYVSAAGRDANWYAGLIAAEPSIISGMTTVSLDELASRDMKVFDVIILADDVGSGGVVAGNAELKTIVDSGANVLAIGRGGRAYVSVLSVDMGGLSVTTEPRQDLYVLDGTMSIFQTPYPIAPQGPGPVQMCQSPQAFTGFDVADLPAEVKALAALSIDAPQSYAMLYLNTGNQGQVHNVYWGFEGNPSELSAGGQECLFNLLNFLDPTATTVPLASASTCL